MELKEMAAKIKELLGISDISNFPKKLMNVLISSDREKVFDDYVSVVGDLEIDYLQKVYQFWLTDRGKGSKQQDFTPESLAKLTASLMQAQDGDTVYDVCAGSGALTIAAWKLNNTLKFVCHEFDAGVIPVLLFNLAIRGIEAFVLRGDVLQNEIAEAWQIIPRGKYGFVRKLTGYTLASYDVCISNPPYNISWDPPTDDGMFGGDERFAGRPVPRKGNANYAFVYHALAHLNNGGRAGFILPVSVLTYKQEVEIRRHLIENGILEAVIVNPQNMFESTGVSTCIMLFRKDAAKGEVVLIDGTPMACQEVREQRGEGSASHANRVYKKTFNVYNEEAVKRILFAVQHRENIPRFLQIVGVACLAERDYKLLPGMYFPLELKEEENLHRPFKDIVDDIREIQREKNAVKITMNESLARKLGHGELIDLIKQSAENTKTINETTIKILDLAPLEPETYFMTSKKAGEIKIENTSKESVSSLFAFFMPMWKQHVYYLNERENKLFVELRDALLPELMSGRLDVSTINSEIGDMKQDIK